MSCPKRMFIFIVVTQLVQPCLISLSRPVLRQLSCVVLMNHVFGITSSILFHTKQWNTVSIESFFVYNYFCVAIFFLLLASVVQFFPNLWNLMRKSSTTLIRGIDFPVIALPPPHPPPFKESWLLNRIRGREGWDTAFGYRCIYVCEQLPETSSDHMNYVVHLWAISTSLPWEEDFFFDTLEKAFSGHLYCVLAKRFLICH